MHSASYCTDLLRQQQVDVALLPATTVLAADDEFDIIPGGAVSSWAYPFARLRIHQDLYQAKALKSIPEQKLKEFLARVILKEHYGRQVQVVFDGQADIELLSESTSLRQALDSDTLDIGQEWYELAQYPMVWGIYACLKGTGTDRMTELLMELTKEAEIIAQEWGARSDSPENRFFGESLRLRLDDVTIAGLTAIRDYMYYYGMTDDLASLPIFESEHAQQLPWWGEDTGHFGGERS